MKNRLQLSALAALGLGGIGMLCRLWLLNSGFDEKGLLIPSHPGIWLCWLLTAAMAAVIVLTVRRLPNKLRYSHRFPASVPAAVGNAAAAVGFFFTGWSYFGGAEDLLHTLCGCACILSAIASLILAFFRLQGKRPGFLPQTVITVFFMLHLYCSYQTWSGEPQLQLILYNVLCLLALTLTSFQRATVDENCGRLRGYCGCALASLFLCLLSLPGDREPVLMVGIAAGLLLELLSLRLSKKA